jgi:hypothetical protein
MSISLPNYTLPKALLLLSMALVSTAIQAEALYSLGAALNRNATEHALSVRAIDVWLDKLESNDRIDLALDDRQVYTAQRSSLEQRVDGLTWRGRFENGDRVVLTRYGDLLAGAIWREGRVFEIQPNGGDHLLVELDTAGFPNCQTGPAEVVLSEDEGHALREPVPSSRGGIFNMDILVVYTPQARAAAGGTASMQATAQAAVDAANTGFIDSDANGRFTLVHSFETSYADSGSSSDDLSWVRQNAEVATLRDRYGADLVGLIVEDGGGGCGRGYVMRNPGPGFEDFAFQVTRRSCAVGNLTFAHEHGHNMGLEHDPANGTSPDNASFPYSFGHFVSGSYRTIMSYSNQCIGGCSRVAHWSNPDVSHNGVPSGIEDERHNQRSINQTAPIVASFRTLPPFSDRFERRN